MTAAGTGPLAGVRIVEMAAIGPVPFGVMILADMGAEVIRVDRAESARAADRAPLLGRGRRSVAFDLKNPEAVAACRALIDTADVLVEGFRPGVMERLGLGPDDCLASNPALIYVRATGWGQTGPLAHSAGHDIDFIAAAGVLGAIGPPDQPAVPLNLVGDYGGGAMLLVTGALLALYERTGSGRGQVIDAAMVDGASLLMTVFHEMAQTGQWDTTRRQHHVLDGGAPYNTVYRTADGRHLAVGPLEGKFFRVVTEILGVEIDLSTREDPQTWPATRLTLETAIGSKTLDEWSVLFAETDSCVFPVLTLDEARTHPHTIARQGFVEADGVTLPAPAPRLGRTPGRIAPAGSRPGADTAAVLLECGFSPELIHKLQETVSVGHAQPVRDPDA